MSEQEQIARDRSKDEAVFAFLKRKGVADSCPQCGSADQLIDEAERMEPAIPYYGYPTPNALSVHQLGVLRLFVLRCENCGHVRLFDRTVVERDAP